MAGMFFIALSAMEIKEERTVEKDKEGLTKEKIGVYEAKKSELMKMGGEKLIRKQHELGKLTARERLDMLFDRGSFQETQLFVKHRSTLFGLGEKEIPADGVITGFGLVNGRTVFAAAQDFTSAGGSLGEMHAKKIWKVMDMALDARKPFVSLNDSGGARIQEGVPSLEGYGGIFYRNTHRFGLHPPDHSHHGPHRRRRRLLSRPDGLGLHGQEEQLHVHHRS